MRFAIETGAGTIAAELPDRPLRLAELAALLVVSDRATELVTLRARVSCREGCAACCRQLVAVSPPEAFHLSEVVDALPRREALIAAFDSARSRLDASPLGRALDAAHISEQRALEIALAYPRLRIDCPFLVDERCSVYADRPAVCREYVVTTPAEHCTMPSPARPIRRVPLPFALSHALGRVAAEVLGGAPVEIPLPRALSWARAHADDSRRMFNPRALVTSLSRALAG